MKKQYMNYMKSCLLVMIACLVSMVGAAQGFSPAAMEQLKTRRLWSHSQAAEIAGRASAGRSDRGVCATVFLS